MNELYKILKSLPQSVLEVIIFKLMCDGKIEFHNITEMHVKYLELLKQGQIDRYRELVRKVIDMHIDGKGKLKKNMGDMLRYLVDCGEANITHEEIDKKYGKKEG